MLMSDDLHEHKNQRVIGIQDETLKKRIEELFNLGIIRPKKMITVLLDENFKIPAK